MNSQKMALDMAKVLYEKQAKDILVLQVDHLTSIADYFVIVNGRSVQSVRALAEDLQEKMEAEGLFPRRKEGFRESRWIVLDYANVIVHIFHPEAREYYHLEKLFNISLYYQVVKKL